MGCTPTLHVFTHVPQCSYNQKQRPFYQKELFIYINIYLGLCKIQKDQIPLNTKTKPQKTNSPVCSTKTGFRGPGKDGPMEECWPGPGRWQSAQLRLPASLVPLNEVLLVGAARQFCRCLRAAPGQAGSSVWSAGPGGGMQGAGVEKGPNRERHCHRPWGPRGGGKSSCLGALGAGAGSRTPRGRRVSRPTAGKTTLGRRRL